MSDFRTVFVRGPENSNIQHFVEKVVFHLHESFPKPKRGYHWISLTFPYLSINWYFVWSGQRAALSGLWVGLRQFWTSRWSLFQEQRGTQKDMLWLRPLPTSGRRRESQQTRETDVSESEQWFQEKTSKSGRSNDPFIYFIVLF